MKRILGLALVLALGLVPSAVAQIATGNIYGDVRDASGAVLQGAAVTLTGPARARATTSGPEGDFRFLNLEAGAYEVRVALAGFQTLTRRVVVTTGENINLVFNLGITTVEETVTVTAETPLVDTKKMGTSTTLTKAELEQIPQARDPWAVLRTIPGIVVDRVNIAGNESGQQASFGAKGSDGADAIWNLDGIQIDDMAAAGASPTYFDYDAFEEIAVGTGGNDLKVQTGAVGLNFVTKRGTNTWHGSGRGFLTHDDLQWTNIKGTELEDDARLKGSDKADHIQQINDYGFELGGPILRDRLWVWGSWGVRDIRLLRTNQTADKTKLDSINAKLNWQVAENTSASVFYFNGKKIKLGRDHGLGIQMEDDALWNQDSFYSDFMPFDLHGLLKFEVNHVFSPNFFLTAKYANYDTGFFLHSRGGLDRTGFIDFRNGIGRGSWLDVDIQRPLKHVTNVDGNYFASGWGGQHEFKFGFGYKKSPVTSETIYGGNDGLVAWDFGGPPTVYVYRQGLLNWEGEFFSAYLGDTFSMDRLTLNAGLRYDHQTSVNLGATIPGNRNFPDLLPDLEYAGGGTGITWSNVSPRVGVTYALDASRKTVARASFARYASKLDTGATTFDNPLGGAYLAYYWDDFNGDNLPQPNEVRFSDGLLYYDGLDPANPARAEDPDRIDPDYKAPTDYEFILGIDRELFGNFAVSAAYTYRRANDRRNWHPRIGMTSADYIPNDPVTMRGFTAQTFSPNDALVAAANGGRIKMNRPDYHQTFSGFELSFIKRLSNRWMGRIGVSYNDHKEHLTGPGAVQNPTRTDTSGLTVSGPQVDGGRVAPRSAGSGKGDAFFSADWGVSGNALYQLPWGFEIAGALYGRQGFPRPIVLSLRGGADGTVRALATSELTTERYPNLWNLDLRLAKNMKLGGTNLIFSAEMFNVLNSNTELNRFRQASSASFNRLDEVLSPRIVRFGARFTF